MTVQRSNNSGGAKTNAVATPPESAAATVDAATSPPPPPQTKSSVPGRKDLYRRRTNPAMARAVGVLPPQPNQGSGGVRPEADPELMRALGAGRAAANVAGSRVLPRDPAGPGMNLPLTKGLRGLVDDGWGNLPLRGGGQGGQPTREQLARDLQTNQQDFQDLQQTAVTTGKALEDRKVVSRKTTAIPEYSDYREAAVEYQQAARDLQDARLPADIQTAETRLDAAQKELDRTRQALTAKSGDPVTTAELDAIDADYQANVAVGRAASDGVELHRTAAQQGVTPFGDVPAKDLTREQARQELEELDKQGRVELVKDAKGKNDARPGMVTLKPTMGDVQFLNLGNDNAKNNLKNLDPCQAVGLVRTAEWAGEQGVTEIHYQGVGIGKVNWTSHPNPYGQHNTGNGIDIHAFSGTDKNGQAFHHDVAKDWGSTADPKTLDVNTPAGLFFSNANTFLDQQFSTRNCPAVDPKGHKDHYHLSVPRTANQTAKSKAFDEVCGVPGRKAGLVSYPCSKADLITAAGGEGTLLGKDLATLPDRTYESAGEVGKELCKGNRGLPEN